MRGGKDVFRVKKKIPKVLRVCHYCEGKFDASKQQCPHCRAFNPDRIWNGDGKGDGTVMLDDESSSIIVPRTYLKTGPWDPCFGDNGKKVGIITGMTYLLGGPPGCGKSTLSIEIAAAITKTTKREVLYIAKEEENDAIRDRKKRLRLDTSLVRTIPMGVEVDLATVLLNRKPSAIILDSLAKACPDPDDAVDFCEALKGYCLALDAPAIITQHINKDEDFAGFMKLQHEVDGTLLFTVYDDFVRELKVEKNRNAPNSKMLFTMTKTGLKYRSPEEDEDEEDA